MMERFQQTEEHLQALLSSTPEATASPLRLSARDWSAWRKRLTRLWSLRYHKIGRKGKIEVTPTKQMGTKEDLSVAYSPGVAEPCTSIKKDEKYVFEYTAKGHLVGVVTNGTAVLGLGNIGPLAAKPVMEGKAVLFKKFADLDSFDIEIDEKDPEKLVDIICALEPTFGGINLEDIKAPECFYVEKECQRRMNIPVFHDDQHGTAIVAGAGLLNALELIEKEIADVRVVVCGVGAAGFTCAKHFLALGVQLKNMLAVDADGVIYTGREDLVDGNYLVDLAVDTPKRTLEEAIQGADVFLGLSVGNLLTEDMIRAMAHDPVVFACANPTPEISPQLARAVRDDVIIATGRSDFANQINNVCAFPYIFRGALDCHARAINEEMELAATHAIARLAKSPPLRRSGSSADLASPTLLQGSHNLEECVFGRDYIIPKPFDERLMAEVATSVVEAAILTDVARVCDINVQEYSKSLADLSETMRRTQ
eukprot:evm.model.scf_584.3 EVM.evm.TU.scf_584.3   scf_584:43334-50562(-)